MNLIKVRSPRGPFCALRLSTPGWPGINRTLNVAHEISMVLVPGNTFPPKLTVMGSLWVLGFCQGRRCCLTYGEDSTDGSISAGEKKNQSPGHTLPLCAAVIFFFHSKQHFEYQSIYNLGFSLDPNHYLWKFSCFGETAYHMTEQDFAILRVVYWTVPSPQIRIRRLYPPEMQNAIFDESWVFAGSIKATMWVLARCYCCFSQKGIDYLENSAGRAPWSFKPKLK